MTDQNKKNSKIPAEKESQRNSDKGFLGTFKWAIALGLLTGVIATRKGNFEQFSHWISGVPANDITNVTKDSSLPPGSRIVKTNVLDAGSLQFSINKKWLTVESVNSSYVDGISNRVKHLLDLPVNGLSNKSPFLLSVPKIYTVTLPNDAGHIFLRHQRVFLKVAQDSKEVVDLLDALTEDQRKNTSFQTGPSILSADQNVIILGDIDKNTVSPNDVFEMDFLNQLRPLLTEDTEHLPMEIQRLSRSQIDNYTIAEIDYTYTLGKDKKHLIALLYWRYEKGASWGDLGSFFIDYDENTSSRNKKAIKKMLASVQIKEGDEKIWGDLNYNTSTDNPIMPVVRVEIDESRLRPYGLTVTQIEKVLASKLPLTVDRLEYVEILSNGEYPLTLRDIAKIYFSHGDGDRNTKIEDFNSIILTVSRWGY